MNNAFIKLEQVPEKYRQKAKNKGYVDLTVGVLITPKAAGHKYSYNYKRFWIEPKYYTGKND